MATWQWQKATTRLRELIEKAHEDGPQVIARHGAERAVAFSIEEYRSTADKEPDFLEYLLSGPKFADFEVERACDTGRKVSL